MSKKRQYSQEAIENAVKFVAQSLIPVNESGNSAETNKREESKRILEKESEELTSYDCMGSINLIEDENEKDENKIKNKTEKKIQVIEATSSIAKNLNPIHPKKQITVISNEPLTEYLKKQKRPISPIRQGKRQTEKLPFALTSDTYVEIVKAKQLKKLEEEAAKENRKRLREEKKRQKENAPKKQTKRKNNKKQEKNNNETVTKPTLAESPAKKKSKANEPICCDVCLSPITRRIINCSQCNKHFHLNCIPSSHRIHIPEDNDNDAFLCHFCYRESNSDLSICDDDENGLFAYILEESKKQRY